MEWMKSVQASWSRKQGAHLPSTVAEDPSTNSNELHVAVFIPLRAISHHLHHWRHRSPPQRNAPSPLVRIVNSNFPAGLLISSFFFFFNLFYFWLCWVFVAARGLSLVAASRAYALLWCAGCSLPWLLLLPSTACRRAGFGSCGSRALERRLSSCGARA